MDIPKKYLEVIEPLIAKARGFVEGGEKLAPIAFVGNFATGQILPVVINTTDDDTKDSSAFAIQMAAAQLKADFVFAIMEAWGLPKDKIDRYEQILDRYGSIGNSPFRVDTASFTLETNFGIWGAQELLKPKGYSKKKRTFGQLTFRHMDGAEGRFVGLLPAREDAPTGGTPLH
jgi:hypothetical protein